MMMKKTVCLLLILIAVAGCSPKPSSKGTSHADYPSFTTVGEVSMASPDIVIAKIVRDDGIQEIDISADPGKPDIMSYRVYTIAPTEVLRGKWNAGEELKIKIRPEEKDAPTFTAGDEAVLFLETYDTVPASLINPAQGSVRIKDGAVPKEERNAWLYEKAEKDTQEMTLDELKKAISEAL